ncbi:DUF6571 family protein [Nonomuraea sp. NEAU-A123]|uniref:DUF6571 family protein n=1 Tax=Nonomuraea sp. NEAU-A123 TaxID=2839649 RepID=UPI001BE400DA|nr:DUF6571 family protein [Nonomuraea sp. NEAU-A123]MBT2235568.1 hypothetical protein [Nonomuraea sp. NEAU-A123]
MDMFITTFKRGGDCVGEEAGALRRLLEQARLTTVDLQPLAATLSWLDVKLPELRRRAQIARAANALTPWRIGLLPFDESRLMSQSEARQKGSQLAERFRDARSGAGPFMERPHDDELGALIAQLDTHRDDPDFTAAFFAGLGVEGTLDIVGKLRAGMRDPEKAIDVVSRAFGTAVRGGGVVSRAYSERSGVFTGTDVPGFAELKNELARGPGKPGDRALGWLLRAGDFPPEWLAKVVRAHALTSDSGLQGKEMAGYLDALGNNPAAARLALVAVRKDGVPLSALLRDLSWKTRRDVSSGPEAADAFGRMLAAAAGAYDEKDGAHSPESAKFAFDLIRALPELDEPTPAEQQLGIRPRGLDDATRKHLAEIAGAYATEITEGANLGDTNRTQGSAFGPVETLVPGLKPAFRLSPEETYAFVKLFANSPATIAPFEEGMGKLTDRLMAAAAQADGNRGIDHLEQVMKALGYTAGMQFAAERAVQGALDEQDKEFREQQTAKLGFLINVAGVPVALQGQPLWIAVSTMAGAMLNDLTEVDKTRLDALDDKTRLAALVRGRWLVDTLMAEGFRPQVSAADERFNVPPIVDENGQLLPFEKLAQSKETLRNLNNWLIANGSGLTDKNRIGEATKQLDVLFRGTKDTAEDEWKRFDELSQAEGSPSRRG